ncbi:unnamed protein product, partial [Mesorhabditis spiculigera]
MEIINQNEDSMMSCDSIDDGLPIINPASILETDSDATLDKPMPVVRDNSLASTGSNSQADKKSLSRLITEDVTYKFTEPKDLVEYEWPAKSGDKWMIQEQISELMQITAFKRRFPEMTSRQIRKEEKEYLINTHKVNTLLSELHMQYMTAIRASEVHDLLCREKPDLFAEYQRLTTEKIKEKMAEQQKEMDRLKKDPKALEDMRQKAIASASAWNQELQNTRKYERKTYWDLQTGVIQSGSGGWKRMHPSLTKPSRYPAALVLGQYQDYYKKYTPAELNRLPLGTVMDGSNLFTVPRGKSPPPINVKEEELKDEVQVPNKEEDFKNVFATSGPIAAAMTPQRETQPRVKVEVPTPKQSDLKKTKCSQCLLAPKADLTMIRCASCHMTVHAECAEMDEQMTAAVLTYPWHCMECKLCTMCHKPDNEDALIICDRCDRGYHTYCVGVEKPPNGSWMCTEFCEAEKSANTGSGRPRRKTAGK